METYTFSKNHIGTLVALVGPTNAGKSTLFNRLIGDKTAITAYDESTTRDLNYGLVDWNGKKFTIVDCGGYSEIDETAIYKKVVEKAETAIEKADIVLYVFDGQEDLTLKDKERLNRLRKTKQVILVANKIDNMQVRNRAQEYDFLGFEYYQVSAKNGKGVGDLLEDINSHVVKSEIEEEAKRPRIAIVGRPNVGKSTLLNCLTNSERSVVSNVAGTTRDPVAEELLYHNQLFELVDTAGVRRRGRIEKGIEDFSVNRTKRIIAKSDAVLVVTDSTENITRGDLHLVFEAKGLNKPVLMLFNKIDDPFTQPRIRTVKGVEAIAISAEKNVGIDLVKDWIAQNIS